MKVVKDGVFEVPLFHGTSTLFLDSIEQYGVGGKDPLDKLGAREFFQGIWELAEKEAGQDESFYEVLNYIRPYATQQNLGGNHSFKHGESYLALIHGIGLNYAVKSFFGSEYLDYMWQLYAHLKNNKVEGLQSFEGHSILKVLLEKSYQPILITVDNVKLNEVETETGRPLLEQLDEIEWHWERGEIVNLNFKLVAPIHKERLSVAYLDRRNFIEDSNGVLIEKTSK